MTIATASAAAATSTATATLAGKRERAPAPSGASTLNSSRTLPKATLSAGRTVFRPEGQYFGRKGSISAEIKHYCHKRPSCRKGNFADMFLCQPKPKFPAESRKGVLTVDL